MPGIVVYLVSQRVGSGHGWHELPGIDETGTGRTRHFLAISTAARAEPFGIAIRSLQRETIVRDPHWNDGAYTNKLWPETGMRLARKLGMISYRSEPEWRQRFGRELQDRYNERLFGMHFSVESYLEMLASIQGHDSFLVDYKRFNPAVGNYLKNLD